MTSNRNKPQALGSDGPRPTSAAEAKIAVIVVNWNGWRYTLDCLASLRKSDTTNWHLIVVDNASTDDSALRLKDLGDEVTVLHAPVNGGWTGGNNLGVRHALDNGYDFLFVLNNDALVLSNTIRSLCETFDTLSDQFPLLGPVHLKGDGVRYDFIGADVDSETGLPRNLPLL